MKALAYFPIAAIFFWLPVYPQSDGDYRSVQPVSPSFPVYDWKVNTTWEIFTALPNNWQDAVVSPDNIDPKQSINILSYVELKDDLILGNRDIILRIGDGEMISESNPYKVREYNILVVYGSFEINNNRPLLSIEENGILVVFGDVKMGNQTLIKNDGFLVIGGELILQSSSGQAEYDEGENGLLFLENGEGDVDDRFDEAADVAYTFEQLCGLVDITEIIDRTTDLRRDILDALCDFMLSGGNVPLPVELMAFEARAAAQAIELSWSTATELNNDFFMLERSVDGIHFEAIATVAGSGTTNETSQYKYTDQTPLLGMAYYRLSQTDFDGTHEVLGVRAVNFIPAGTAFSILPNPLRDSRLLLHAAGLSSGREATFRITDLTGRTVYELSFFPEREVINQEVEIDSPLRRGFYLAELQQSDHRFTQKLVVE